LVKSSFLLGIGIGIIIIALIGYYVTTGGSTDTDDLSDDITPITIKLTETQNEKKEWVPNVVYVKVGDKIELTVVNGDDDDEHRLAIPDLGVETNDIPGANERDIVTFTVNEKGSFVFIESLAPDFESELCEKEQAGEPQGDEEEFLCVPPGKLIVEE
jgi:heme/copper-type cytochrome/quinol oxidase subunit 2